MKSEGIEEALKLLFLNYYYCYYHHSLIVTITALLQVARLRLCEKLLVAMELAAYLNDTSFLLQSIVQCYGLLAPLLYFKLPSLPVIQVVTCHIIRGVFKKFVA